MFTLFFTQCTTELVRNRGIKQLVIFNLNIFLVCQFLSDSEKWPFLWLIQTSMPELHVKKGSD